MNINWQNISQQEFISDYWQKKPVVLKNALPNFAEPITPDEVAGLAMESFIDSRLVTNKNGDWKVTHGPIEQFDELGDSHWSLLVQGVDRWIPTVFDLRSAVDFIPKWRIDDVMVSYSTPHAGVGSHLDQYDVFIVQGQGKRRWKAGAVDSLLQQTEKAKDLLQVDDFTAIVDEVLEPGDIIYIPPFSPHNGETIETAINYSIGFRAPSQQELISGFADFVIDSEIGLTRFQDDELVVNNQSDSLINDAQLKKMQLMLTDLINNDGHFEKFLNQGLTAPSRELDIPEEVEQHTTDYLVNLFFNSNLNINKVNGVETSIYNDGTAISFFCCGEEFVCESHQIDFIRFLHHQNNVTSEQLKSSLKWLENIQLVTTLINQGYWYIDE
ncbi:cupin domain-containing protein [uncultured Psychrosphaera sp.]|jgi:50S ribosomal protein L16 3-hydroxylase|uniref:cupin domain-containing protein n=1 Tax=uncultured Psychrosphaera sp. TaxID=1403522 RepID=UPI0030F93ADE